MSWSLNHYHYDDLRRDLKKLGLLEDVEILLQLERNISDAYLKRSEVANQLLKKHIEKLTPLLRPCHKKRIAELTVGG